MSLAFNIVALIVVAFVAALGVVAIGASWREARDRRADRAAAARRDRDFKRSVTDGFEPPIPWGPPPVYPRHPEIPKEGSK